MHEVIFINNIYFFNRLLWLHFVLIIPKQVTFQLHFNSLI